MPAPLDCPGKPRVAAVIPVGADSTLLDGCLECLRSQDRPIDQIVVVDDSIDAGLDAPPGVTVLQSRGRGPYAARNVGWRECQDTDLILFADTRSRPHREWAGTVIDLFADTGVAIAGTDITVLGGPSLAEQTSEYHQFFRIEWYVNKGFFLPYLPTCNLAVRTVDLDAVGGFREPRSGGDADLCWRILKRPGRRLVTDPRPLMEWIPRARVRDYLEQNYRYGRSNRALRVAWRSAGAPQLRSRRKRRLLRRASYVGSRLAISTLRGRQEQRIIWLRRAGRIAFQFGYRKRPDVAEGLGPAELSR